MDNQTLVFTCRTGLLSATEMQGLIFDLVLPVSSFCRVDRSDSGAPSMAVTSTCRKYKPVRRDTRKALILTLTLEHSASRELRLEALAVAIRKVIGDKVAALTGDVDWDIEINLVHFATFKGKQLATTSV